MANLPQVHKTLGRSQAAITRQARNVIGNEIYDGEWRKVSTNFRKDNPLCLMCLKEDRIEASTLVDHIVPVRVAPERRMDETNLQALCKEHHRLKTMDDYTRYPKSYGNTF